MNAADLIDICKNFAALTADEQASLDYLINSTPVTLTQAQRLEMQAGVENVLKPALTPTTGVAPLNADISSAITQYETAGGELVTIGLNVLINLFDWPPIGLGPATVSLAWERDIDVVFPTSWSHAVEPATNPLFSDGLSDTWALVVADPTIVTDIQDANGGIKLIIWEGYVQFNADGTEDTTYTSGTTPGTGTFRAPNTNDLRLHGLLL